MAEVSKHCALLLLHHLAFPSIRFLLPRIQHFLSQIKENMLYTLLQFG